MVRCMIRSHNQQYKIASRGDDAENMCGTTLEPDPRYDGCCSNIFRPGKVLRDIVIGFLVVLAIAVVIAVLFVVCFYVLPETESTDKLEESAFVGKPIEDEVNINEIELTDDTRYDVRPEVVLENIRKDEDLHDHIHEDGPHEDHHHAGSMPEVEFGVEESEIQPELETENVDHEHMHKNDGMSHEHVTVEDEGMVPEEDMVRKSEMPHEESEATHGEMMDNSEFPHGHIPEHTGEEMHDEHLIDGREMSHKPEMSHEHHESGMDEMLHEQHESTMDEMPQEHMHGEDSKSHDHVHTDSHDHTHTDSHDHMHEDSHDHTHTDSHDHMHEDSHDHTHTDTHDHIHEEEVRKATEIADVPFESEHPHEHTMEHEHEGIVFAPSAPANEEALEVVGAPALETTPEMPTERTVVSVSSPSGPSAKIQVQSSDSEFTATSDSERFEGLILPPLFETLGPRFNGTGQSLSSDDVHDETLSGKEPEEFIVPEFGIEEVDAPILTNEEVLSTEPIVSGPCRKRQLEMCSDLPYGLTSLPNWANDQNEKDLNESSLPFFRDVIVRSGCSPRARQYACGILEPPCKSDGSIVPPCRTFCRSVAATCREFVLSAVSLSSVFDCEKFPDSADPSVCFDMTQEPCIGLEHRCGDGRCVARRLVCDGLPDCVDQSDEATCPNRVQAPEDEVLVEGSSPVPSIPTDQEQPSSPVLELSLKESPVPDLPTLPLEEEPIEPVVLDEILPIDIEEFLVTTQEYPAETLDAEGQDPTTHSQLTTEEVVEVLHEEPSFPEVLIDSEPEVYPEEEFVTTEGPLSAAAIVEFEGTEGDHVSSEASAIHCDHENFLCHDGANCVALSAVCDGYQQCTDGSDEFNCTHIDFAPVVSSTTTTVTAGIESETQTNFPVEAVEGAAGVTTFPEETFEETTVDFFGGGVTTLPSSGCPELQCLDGTCLALSQLNDGVNDCPDGTDEHDFDYPL